MKANPLDPQYARFGTFDQLRENSREQLKDIITSLGTGHRHGSLEQKVGDLYNMGLDSVRRNNAGFAPLSADLDVIAKSNKKDFVRLIAWMHNGLGDPFFNSAVMSDLKDSNTNLFYLMQGGLGMGDRDYYLENDGNTVKVRAAYSNYISKLFQGRKKRVGH